MADFIIRVQNNGEYDLKRKTEWQLPYEHFFWETSENFKTLTPFMYFEGYLLSAADIGNLNYGYVGAVYGFDLGTLLLGGDVYQWITDGHWGDYPEDKAMVEWGYELYMNGF